MAKPYVPHEKSAKTNFISAEKMIAADNEGKAFVHLRYTSNTPANTLNI